MQNINKHFSITDGRNKVLSLCLVNCYRKITQEKAFEVTFNLTSDYYYYAWTRRGRLYVS